MQKRNTKLCIYKKVLICYDVKRLITTSLPCLLMVLKSYEAVANKLQQMNIVKEG